MKKPRGLLLSLLVVFGVFLTFSFAPQNQKAPPTPSSAKVKNILLHMQKANSLEELGQAHSKDAFIQEENDSLLAQIKASPNLQNKLRLLAEKAKAEGQAKLEQAKKEALEEEKALQQEENKLSIQSDKGKVATGKARGDQNCNAPHPSISGVTSPVRPGWELTISGVGFGEKTGRVKFVTQGKSYVAEVTSWTGCSISALIPNTITGVKGDNMAVVSLTTANSQTTKGNTKFVPIFEVRSRSVNGHCDGGIISLSLLGITISDGKCDNLYWNSNLKNDWQLVSQHVKLWTPVVMSNAKIVEASPIGVPNGLARVKVHSGADVLALAIFTTYQYAKGPRGLDPW